MPRNGRPSLEAGSALRARFVEDVREFHRHLAALFEVCEHPPDQPGVPRSNEGQKQLSEQEGEVGRQPQSQNGDRGELKDKNNNTFRHIGKIRSGALAPRPGTSRKTIPGVGMGVANAP